MGELDRDERDVVARIVTETLSEEQLGELLRGFSDERCDLILRVASDVMLVLEHAAAIEAARDQRPTVDLRPPRSAGRSGVGPVQQP